MLGLSLAKVEKKANKKDRIRTNVEGENFLIRIGSNFAAH